MKAKHNARKSLFHNFLAEVQEKYIFIFISSLQNNGLVLPWMGAIVIVDDWRVTVCVCSAAHLVLCSRNNKYITNSIVIKNNNKLNKCQVLYTQICTKKKKLKITKRYCGQVKRCRKRESRLVQDA